MFEQFHFKASDGSEIVVPRMSAIKGKRLRETRKMDSEDRSWELLWEIASDEAKDAIDNLPSGDVINLLNKWGETLGESTRSST